MNFFRSQRLRNSLLLVAFWIALTLAFACQLHFYGPLSWSQAIRLSLRDWLPWAVMSPAILWLAKEYRLERRQWLLNLPMHLAACIVAIAMAEVVATLVRPGRVGPPDNPPRFNRSPPPRPRQEPPRSPPFGPRPRQRVPPLSPPSWFDIVAHNIAARAKFNIPIYWVLVSAGHALYFYRRSQERERRSAELEARLTQSRIQALQMQLQPHFLFNTLNAIATLMHKDPDAADEMIGNLSDLLRTALDNSQQQEVSLRDELAFLDRYLEIQQVRFGDRLRVERKIDPALFDALVPNLILQPLVENAIRHGIERHSTPGTVTIGVHRAADKLRLLVEDKGEDWNVPPAGEVQEGIGLSNTRARLRELYGEQHDLVCYSAGGGGFCVELTIPIREKESGSSRQA